MRNSLILAVTAGAAAAAMLAPAAASAATYGSATLRHPAARHRTSGHSAAPSPTAAPTSAANTAPGTAPTNVLTTVPSTGAGSGGDPDTTLTFDVTSGLLTMTAPTTAPLGSGAPGTTITGVLGAVVVTDDRALLGGLWTAVASSTDFTTGAATTAETIPATDATYTPGTPFVTGSFVATPHTITLSNAPQTIMTSTGNGNNTATWSPTIAVAVPSAAVVGAYTATMTQSVS
jgi:hypothetical protein